MSTHRSNVDSGHGTSDNRPHRAVPPPSPDQPQQRLMSSPPPPLSQTRVLSVPLLWWWLATSAAVMAVSWPALSGDWVYDDQILPGHALLASWRDIPGALGRNSDSYLPAADPSVRTVATYRPLPMASFALVGALLGHRPWAHHLVSLFLYLGLLGTLASIGARRGRLAYLPAFLVTAFALHPAFTEGWQWVNGRSDVMAGLALAGLAVARRACRGNPRQPLVLLPILLAGALSKETFLIAAAALLLAEAAGEEGSWWRGWPTALAWAASAGLFWAARAATLTSTSGLPPLLSARGIAKHGAHLMALAAETLVVPLPRPMRLLSWELSRPWTTAHLALLAAVILGVAVLALSRRWRALFLALGAIMTLAPSVALADGFWLGFDRYLIQPAVLLALAALPAAAGWCPPVRRGVLVPLSASVALVLLWLGMACHSSASAYRSHRAFCSNLVEARPQDPTGYLIIALDALQHGERERAALALARLPRGDLPGAHAHRVVKLDLQLGHLDAAVEVAERARAARPDDPRALVDLVLVRIAQRRLPEAQALAEELVRRWPDRRAAVAGLLSTLSRHQPAGPALTH